MPFIPIVWKKTRQITTGILSSAWEKARAAAGGLTSIAFTASSAFDLEKIFLNIKGTGLIFPILTAAISGIVYVKEATQEKTQDGIKALQKNKLFDFQSTPPLLSNHP